MKITLRHIKNNHVLQHSQSDCGVACLLSVIRHHGGSESTEKLRQLSGTTPEGTKMYGLYLTAIKLGFDTSCFRSEIECLKKVDAPVILHFVYDNGYQHYVVCYGFNKERGFLIGDPGHGVLYLQEKILEKWWEKKNCLALLPNKNFITTRKANKNKKELLLNFIKEDYRQLLFTIIIGVCIAISTLTLSIFTQRLIDNILPTSNTHKLVFGIILLSLLLFFRIGFVVLKEYIITKQARDCNLRINQYFFKNILQLQKHFFDCRQTGEFVARLNDTQRIQEVIKLIISNTITEITICIISIIVLWMYSSEIALICVFSLPVYFYVIYRNHKKIIGSQRSIMQAYALAESSYIATVQGVGTIKNENKQGLFEKLNTIIYRNFQDMIFNMGLINIRISWQAGLVGVLFLMCILYFSAHAVLNHEIKIGVLMAIISISGSLLPSIGNLALIVIPISEAKIAFDRMYDFISAEKETFGGEDIRTIDQIELKNVSFCFAGRSPLFNDASITLSRGTITALNGNSGSGKTTIANILQKFYQWDTGQITINKNIDLRDISVESWRRKIGVIPQEIHIFNGSVLFNIVLDENCNDLLLKEIIENYDFSEFISGFPNGLLTLIGEEGINISGGQKQLIGLLRVLYRQPQFYIFDEPTVALDNTTELIVVNALKKIKQNSMILLISHKKELINNHADVIYNLHRGCIKRIQNMIDHDQ